MNIHEWITNSLFIKQISILSFYLTSLNIMDEFGLDPNIDGLDRFMNIHPFCHP